ncbi:hypothetical protein ScalyP_jg9101, partial [Parmales sp. scaly parma]
MAEVAEKESAVTIKGCPSLLSLFSENSLVASPPSRTAKPTPFLKKDQTNKFNESLKNLGVQEVDDDWDDVDDDELPPQSENNSYYKTASFAISMSQYAMRRAGIEEQINSGELIAVFAPGVPLLNQVNPEMYSDEAQLNRRKIKKSKTFLDIVEKFWHTLDLIKNDDGSLEKESYFLLTFKITLLLVPPPINLQIARASAEQDWEIDSIDGKLRLAKFQSCIFTLVDIWAETTNLTEYTGILLRLIQGITINEEKELRFKPDELIVFDQFFGLFGGLEATTAPKTKTRERTQSALVKEAGTTKIKTKTKTNNVLLSLTQTNTFIAKLYSEKRKNDEWRAKKRGAEQKLIPFDKFILKFFQTLHGTRGIARRHLRTFV